MMHESTEPVQNLGPGDKIEHNLMPGFVMVIEGMDSCEIDGARPEPHMKYKVHDPEGNVDWLCAYDVSRAVRECD
jgi:hypothetical protein